MANWRLYLKSPVIIPLILLLISTYVLIAGFTYPSITGQFPILIASITIILTIWELVLNVTKIRSKSGIQSEKSNGLNKRTLFITLGMFLYLFIIWVVGFLIATVLFILVSTHFLGLKKWWLSLVLAAGTVLFLYIVFNLLFGVSLPVGILFE